MIDIPRGFLAIPDDENGTYIPFFLKVRSDDIIWNTNNLHKYIKFIKNGDSDVEIADPTIYKFDIPIMQLILIDDVYNNIYFRKDNKYYKYKIDTLDNYTLDINNDGNSDDCRFIFGTVDEVPVPKLSMITDSLKTTNYTWRCRVNPDGYVTAQTFIPFCNYGVQLKDDMYIYYCYSLYDYDSASSFMDFFTLNNIKLPIPILSDTINIQIDKKSDMKEFTNTFTSSNFKEEEIEIQQGYYPYLFNVVNNINIELNTLNKIPGDSFMHTLRNCGVYINITGYAPIVKD